MTCESLNTVPPSPVEQRPRLRKPQTRSLMLTFLCLPLFPLPASACFSCLPPLPFCIPPSLIFFWQKSNSSADGLLLVGVLCQPLGNQEGSRECGCSCGKAGQPLLIPLGGGSGREAEDAQMAGPRSAVPGPTWRVMVKAAPRHIPGRSFLQRGKETGVGWGGRGGRHDTPTHPSSLFGREPG